MIGKKKVWKSGEVHTLLSFRFSSICFFFFFFFFFRCRIAYCFLPNHAEHPSMQGYRLAVHKTDLFYDKNIKGVF